MELKGKIIDFLGDSITEGHGVDNLENRYDNVMLRNYGLKAVHNYGIGGTRLAHQSAPSEYARHDLCFCGRAFDLNTDADIIVVYGGVNDYGHGDAPIGQIGDKTPATFCGAVDYLMNLLLALYPDKKVVFMTPARCCFEPWGSDYTHPSTDFRKKPDAKPARYYGEVIMEIAAKYNIPVLDLYEKLQIDPLNPEDKLKFTADGLHFNDIGHAVIAGLLAEFLTKL